MLATLVRGAEPRFHAWQIPRACMSQSEIRQRANGVRPSGRWAAGAVPCPPHLLYLPHQCSGVLQTGHTAPHRPNALTGSAYS